MTGQRYEAWKRRKGLKWQGLTEPPLSAMRVGDEAVNAIALGPMHAYKADGEDGRRMCADMACQQCGYVEHAPSCPTVAMKPKSGVFVLVTVYGDARIESNAFCRHDIATVAQHGQGFDCYVAPHIREQWERGVQSNIVALVTAVLRLAIADMDANGTRVADVLLTEAGRVAFKADPQPEPAVKREYLAADTADETIGDAWKAMSGRGVPQPGDFVCHCGKAWPLGFCEQEHVERCPCGRAYQLRGDTWHDYEGDREHVLRLVGSLYDTATGKGSGVAYMSLPALVKLREDIGKPFTPEQLAALERGEEVEL